MDRASPANPFSLLALDPSNMFNVITTISLDLLKLRGLNKVFAGGPVVAHVSLTTVMKVRFLPHAVISLKLPWSQVGRVLSSLTLSRVLLWALRFPPVVALEHEGWSLLDL